MEFNPDLTSLQALPLDQGLFALRRPTPPPSDDSPSFRQHLETQRGRTDQDGPEESPVKAGAETRRERPDNSNRTAANRGETRSVAHEDRAANDDAAPLDDTQSTSPGTDDQTDPQSTDSLPVASDAAADELDDAKIDDADEIIAEATAIAITVAAAPIELETSVMDVLSSEAPAIEPFAEIAPSTPTLPKKTSDAKLLSAPTRPDESPQETVEATAATTPALKSTDEPKESKPIEKASETNESSLKGVAEIQAEKKAESRAIDKDNATNEANRETTSGETTARVSETEDSSNNDEDRPRKGAAKVTVSSTESNAPTTEPASSRQAPLHQTTNNNASPGFAIPAATVAVAAEKVAASASQSAGGRVGSVESAAPQRLPQHLVGKPGEAPAGEVKLTEAEQVRILQRVARAFQTAQQREGEIRIRLSPPELGAIKLEIKVHDGVMSARVEAETQAAQSLLIDNLPALRERLAEQNIRLENFEVGLQGRQSQSQHDHRDSQSEGNGSRPFLGGREREAGASAEGPLTASRHHDGKLNVFI